MRPLLPGLGLILLVAALLLLSDLGQRRGTRHRLPHVALVQQASQPLIDEGARGILEALGEAGFRDGETMILRRFNAEGDIVTANAIARAVATREHDLLISVSTVSLQTVANANANVGRPHVFALVSDPAGAGVGIDPEDPLRHPPHLAGYGTLQPVAATFDLARRMNPGLRRIGTVWNPSESNSEVTVRLARKEAARLGFEWREATVESTAGVREATAALLGRGVEALWIGADITLLTALEVLIDTARAAGVPVFTSNPGSAARGALFDVGANYLEVGHLAGRLAVELLRGRDPATVAIENVVPERLLVNREVLARFPAWHLPADALARAEFVEEPAGAERPAAQAIGNKAPPDAGGSR